MILTIIAAVFLRLPQMNQRPMHGDEAVNATKFIQLAEGDGYRYDPHEFHGPLLEYLTVPWKSVRGADSRQDYNATFFRSLIAVLGVLLVLATCYSFRMIGPGAAISAATLCAISPAMVFFSRYYIHEMLLALTSFMTIYCGWRYARSRAVGWAIALGTSVGLMHATKETCVLIWFAMIVAATLTWWITQKPANEPRVLRKGSSRYEHAPATDNADEKSAPFKWHHMAWALLAAALVSVTLFSSFYTNWAGPLDSLRTYQTWISLGTGEQAMHVHPWWWYLRLLTWYHEAPGPTWSEGLIVGLSLVGAIVALTGYGVKPAHRGAVTFIVFYTLVLLGCYSAIPYKTPWIVLGPLHGMILLAGVGAAALIAKTPTTIARIVVCIILAALSVQLARQAHATSYRFDSDRRNPWVYAHPTRNVLRLARRTADIAQISGLYERMPILVIDDGNYWPLPYYLRLFEHVGYFTAVPDRLVDLNAPVVIAGAKLDPVVDEQLAATHHGEYFGLRPGVVISMYIRNDLWQTFIQQQSR